MVETITPVVHGGRARWSGAVALHALGASAAAALFGATLGALGAGFGAPFGGAGTVSVGVVAGIYAIAELTGHRLPVPQLRRQVPNWWRTFFPASVAALLYGFGLGVGFLTFLAHGTLVAISALALASGRPLVGALIIGPFGFARGLSILRARRIRTIEDGRRLVMLLGASPRGRRASANGLSLLILAVAAWAATPRGADWPGVAGAGQALCFAWSAGAKLMGRRRWDLVLVAHELPDRVVRTARWGVPAAEALVPILTFLGYGRAAGLWGAILVASFSIQLVRLWRGGRRVPCGCFGGRRSVDVRIALLRNTGLVGLALMAATAPNAPWASWPGAPEPGEILPMVLAWVGVGVAVWVTWRAAAWLGRAAEA